MPGPDHPPRQRIRRLRLLSLAISIVTLGGLGGLAWAAQTWHDDGPQGLVFVIPAGSAATLELPGIDSAIEIPTDIRFGPGDVATITVINQDSSLNRAGPWLVDAGQSITFQFNHSGTYQFDCVVDASESVTVTVVTDDVAD